MGNTFGATDYLKEAKDASLPRIPCAFGRLRLSFTGNFVLGGG
jgi:hypothetical protein